MVFEPQAELPASPDPTPEMPENPSEQDAFHPRSLVSRVLSPAVRLWLRSQVDAVEALQVQIEGGDRQILTGHIPKVSLTAHKVVYQGIALSDIALVGEGIRVNLGQVLRGQPLRLLEAVPIQAVATIQQEDLNTSLQAPLLANAIKDLLLTWLQEMLGGTSSPTSTPSEVTLLQPQAKLHPSGLTLSATVRRPSQPDLPLALRTNLQVMEASKICLRQPQVLLSARSKRGLPLAHLEGWTIDLGSEVLIQELALEEGQMRVKGQLTVMP